MKVQVVALLLVAMLAVSSAFLYPKYYPRFGFGGYGGFGYGGFGYGGFGYGRFGYGGYGSLFGGYGYGFPLGNEIITCIASLLCFLRIGSIK